MREHLAHHIRRFNQIPLWKRILIIIIVIAMPVFFATYRNMQIQQTLQSIPPAPIATDKSSSN